MVSYSIDASVYAFPFKEGISDPNEIISYYQAINDLYEVIIEKQPHDKKYYLFLRDIELINDNDELNLLAQNISQLDQMSRNANIPITLREAQKFIGTIIKRLLPVAALDSNPLSEIIIFENWFNIEDVTFTAGKSPSLPNDLTQKINNEKLRENTKKNIVKIAYLNKYIYNNDNIHNIILGNYVTSKTITLINYEFDVKMNFGFYSEYGTKYTYKIKNAPLNNVCISNKNVGISTLDALVNNNHNYNDWEKALDDAQKNFKDHLVFGPKVNESLEEYINKINDENKKYKLGNQKIINWIKEGPDTLYENLKALNFFLDKADLTLVPKNKNERYHCCKKCEGNACPEDEEKGYSCKGKCEFLEICGSNIRYFGVDCVDERWQDKNDTSGFVKEDREKMNSENVKEKYWIHLRPKTMACDDNLWFMTLRIHFRYLGNGKIEIGWIGRHLYLPCKKRDHIHECNRGECPLNPKSPLHDPNVDELTNYLKQ